MLFRSFALTSWSSQVLAGPLTDPVPPTAHRSVPFNPCQGDPQVSSVYTSDWYLISTPFLPFCDVVSLPLHNSTCRLPSWPFYLDVCLPNHLYAKLTNISSLFSPHINENHIYLHHPSLYCLLTEVHEYLNCPPFERSLGPIYIVSFDREEHVRPRIQTYSSSFLQKRQLQGTDSFQCASATS